MANQNNLYSLKRKIINIIIIFLFISIVVSAVLFFLVYNKNQKNRESDFKLQVRSANLILQSSIAAQISIIVNNAAFISYINSGELSRQRHYGDIRWLFNNLDYNLIRGISIEKYNSSSNIPFSIFSYGKSTNYFTVLDFCYLNNRVDNENGDCIYKHVNATIYFDQSDYLKKLNFIDSRIIFDAENDKYFIFYPFNKTFYNFKVLKSQGSLKVAIHKDKELDYFLILLASGFILIAAIVFIISHRILQNLIEKNLVNPIKRITDSLNKGDNIQLERGSNIEELSKLIEVVNNYNDVQFKLKLSKIAAAVAHDIKSPLSAIEFSIADILEPNHPKRKIIKNAIRLAKSIADNMLILYSRYPHATTELIQEESRAHVLIEELVQEIIAQKQAEWKICKDMVKLNYSFVGMESAWGFLSRNQFSRHISNLLNNSFEAKRIDYIQIDVSIEKFNNFIKIQIKDNGVGIDKEFLPLAINGGTLKDGGHGIGLESAIAYLKNEEGFLEIDSEKGLGTTVQIFIQKTSSPEWLAEIISLKEMVVIIDDDNSWIEYWTDKLKSFNLEIQSFSSPNEFFDWYSSVNLNSHVKFFVDYDYNTVMNGLDIIEKIHYKANCILITNNYSDPYIQEQILTYGSKMIPKSLLSTVSILIYS